jgi:hypothetical protein
MLYSWKLEAYREPETHAELVAAFGDRPIKLHPVPLGWRSMAVFFMKFPVVANSVAVLLTAHCENIVEVRLAREDLVVVRAVSPKRTARDLERLVVKLARELLERA